MKISIITPSFNQRGFIEKTLESILSQQGNFELELFVMDGGSTDGSVEVLRSINDTRLVWTSQADHGQSDAINRGLAQANGDVVAWLNSDDLYTPGALQAVHEAFSSHLSAQWLVAGCAIIDDEGRTIRPGITQYKWKRLKRYAYKKLLRENIINQPSVFWRREFGRRIGSLDESLHWTMDYDLWLRMGRACDPLILDRTTSQFRIHGSSKSGQVDRRQFDEQYRVASRYFAGDKSSQLIHRLNVEKIVWAYRVMRWLGV